MSESISIHISPHAPSREHSLSGTFVVARKGESDSRYISREKIKKNLSKYLAVDICCAVNCRAFFHLKKLIHFVLLKKTKYFFEANQSQHISIANRQRAKHSAQLVCMSAVCMTSLSENL